MLGATHAIFPQRDKIEFDAVSDNSVGNAANTTNVSWTHIASGEGRIVFVVYTVLQTSDWYYNHGRSVTYGGVQMASLGAEHVDAEHNRPFVEIYYLKNPPTGPQTVNVTVTRASTSYPRLSGVALSYKNCKGVYGFSKVVGAAAASGTAMSHTVSALNSSEFILQAFLSYLGFSTGSFSNYSHTLRHSLPATGGGADNSMVVGDAPGNNPSVTITATRPTSSGYSASVAVVLTPDYLTREENINRSNYPVPSQAVDFRVKLIGAGGSGGTGWQGGAHDCGGGGGGGGAAVLDTGWQPVSLIGSTYTTTRGLGAASSNGGDSVFSSGSVVLTAGGGLVGANGIRSSSAKAVGGAGGTATISGLSGVASQSGTEGGEAGTGRQASTGNASVTPDNTSGGAAGGGGGGGMSGFNVGTPGQGAKGGDSLFAVGGATGRPGVIPVYNGFGNVGAGGGGGNNASGSNAGADGATGGLYGGGGGGGSGAGSGAGIGGIGGEGYTLVEFR